METTSSALRLDHVSESDAQEDISTQTLNLKYFYDKKFNNEITDCENSFDDDADDDENDAGDEEDEEEEDEEKNQDEEEKIGLCAVCQLAVRYSEFENDEIYGRKKPFFCSQRHLLCQRCIEYYAIQLETGCILCGNKLQNVLSTRSRASSNSVKDKNHDTTKMHKNIEPHLFINHKEKKNSYLSGGFNTAEHLQVDPYVEWCSSQCECNDMRNQYIDYCHQIRKNTDGELALSEMKMDGEIIVECSRRPIQCPRIDCAINVAFSSLTHHFLFDHPEVPILNIELDAKSTLMISFSGLSCDSSSCLAVLLVSTKLTGSLSKLFNGNQIHPKYRNRLPLPVLAARLHCTDYYTTHDDIDTRGEGNGESDIIIAWIAGLDISGVGALHCTIEAVDSLDGNTVRSSSYRGPINSLRTAQRPRDVFLAGDCLILHEGMLNHLTSESTTLNINVIVH